ncbi:MAG TPA: 3-deoxy-7-phosphoheptulonate synthase [Candidatus Binatia bacterium]|nr:3-deoxy-7-phosphoheptulonate synthase [Candidatus Binatia bacterium]
MIILLKPDVSQASPEVDQVLRALTAYPGVSTRIHAERGQTRSVIEIHVIGNTAAIPKEPLEELPGVQQVVRVSDRYRLIGRHKGQVDSKGFEYNGVRFDQDSLHVFAGLCAVDSREHAEVMLRALHGAGLTTTRMGAYKPRTSPYDFQGHGRECLPYVFELAGRYGIRVIAMEVTHEQQIGEIRTALERAGNPTGVMLQIGTRNAQNFELLKVAGQQTEFPVLYKRGMGITLEESFNACEYVASEGNRRIVFCLRGVKSNLGDPHRNFVDVAHVPVVKRLTRLPVCVDPSHSIGRRESAPDGMLDIHHISAQAVIAGANMLLVDFHPAPEAALCDGPQALLVRELEAYLEDVRIVRDAYEKRRALSAAAASH